MARFVVGVSLILLLASVAFSQSPPQSSPQAVSFAAQSIAALTGGNAIHDVTLTGSVAWSGAATPETGTATLIASGAALHYLCRACSSAMPGGWRHSYLLW
jgi:hypothetical protein